MVSQRPGQSQSNYVMPALCFGHAHYSNYQQQGLNILEIVDHSTHVNSPAFCRGTVTGGAEGVCGENGSRAHHGDDSMRTGYGSGVASTDVVTHQLALINGWE